MRRHTIVGGVVLVFGGGLGASAGLAQPEAASSPAARVEAFDRLGDARIGVPAGPDGVPPLRAFCPEEENETCRKYWEYTINFVGNYIIPLRDKELLILRTAWLSRGDYIWGRHAVMGRNAGLTDAEIARVTEGPDAAGWDAFDATLLRAADDLHRSRFIAEATWTALGERYTEPQLREVVLIVGNYTQLAMFQNTLGVQLPPDVPGLPR